jgi:hypothetical protein
MQQFTQRVRVSGAIRKDWTNEQGQRFQSTRIFISTSLDTSKGDQFGQAAAEYIWGDAANFDKLPKVKDGFDADVTFENVFNGKIQKMIIVDVKPVKAI